MQKFIRNSALILATDALVACGEGSSSNSSADAGTNNGGSSSTNNGSSNNVSNR